MRPRAPALPLGRLATLAEVREAIAFDVITTGVPRRSCRVQAHSEREARILAAVELRVDLERVVIRPATYSLVSLELC